MNIDLYDGKIPYDNGDHEKPTVLSYLTPTWYKIPAVIVLPGGGYTIYAEHEAEPIAEFYKSRGFHAFVLKYRLIPNDYPAALCDLQTLIKYLRKNSDRFKIDPNRIFVIGFSAGGHLAALSAVSEDVTEQNEECLTVSYKPTGVLLGYPVINIEHACVKSFCGNREDLFDKLSIDKQITGDTPKMFIWHTSDDAEVSVLHSLQLCKALRENNIKYELHVFPSGKHGLGLAQLMPDVSQWGEFSVKWIINNF